jgi:hypothetical protein
VLDGAPAPVGDLVSITVSYTDPIGN